MKRLDAVLPLRPSDVARATLLLRSLARFFDDLGEVFVVVPDAERGKVEAALARGFSDRLRISVHPETSIVPELRPFRKIGGWYKQQLIKLAISEHVATDFYLTLDADVVATRRVSPAQLVPDGRALTYVIPQDLHPRWYERSATLLERPLRRTGIVHNVTPAILARDGVRALASHFGERFQSRRWARGLRAFRQRWTNLRFGGTSGLAPWRLFLASALPWTEYSLYYSFLEVYDLFDRYHVEHERCVYDIERSIWSVESKANFSSWSPEPLFDGEGPPFFVVLQSNSGLSAEEALLKLEPYLD